MQKRGSKGGEERERGKGEKKRGEERGRGKGVDVGSMKKFISLRVEKLIVKILQGLGDVNLEEGSKFGELEEKHLSYTGKYDHKLVPRVR